MDNNEDLITDLRKWVSAEALKIDNVEQYDLKIHGGNNKGEHYGSDIAFVDMSAKNFDEEKKEYNLVIKYGQTNQTLRETLPIRHSFEREIDVYSKVIPLYHAFQQEKKLPLFTSLPNCYLTKFTDTEEVLIFENLNKLGYTMYNRQVPMDISHIKLVLEAYAEWHALSFALKDQKPEDFFGIIKNWTRIALQDFLSTEQGKMFEQSQQLFYEMLTKIGEIELLNKYKEKMGYADIKTKLLDLLDSKESQSVVIHGDCWNNNFLFKYEEDEFNKPHCTKVALLDFQIAALRSPAFDLSHFIYAVSSEEQLKDFHKLINHYYSHFSNHMLRLGSDPEKLFSFSDLIRHFEKYSAYGVLFSHLIILFCLLEKENAPDFAKNDALGLLKLAAEHEQYKSRSIAVARHFVNFSF